MLVCLGILPFPNAWKTDLLSERPGHPIFFNPQPYAVHAQGFKDNDSNQNETKSDTVKILQTYNREPTFGNGQDKGSKIGHLSNIL
jgi:hypothetical protein